MARNENIPMDRGYVDSSGAFATQLGKEYEVEDIDWSATTGAKPSRTGSYVRLRLVKNSSGLTLLPKRLVKMKVSNGVDNVGIVDGYCNSTAERGYPIDEFCPAAGIPDGSVFYIVTRGPAKVLLPIAGTEFNGDIAVGQSVVALTAVTSGATTAGRVAAQNITGSSQAVDYTFLVNQIQNVVGRALSAKTTGNTNADLLIDVGRW